MNMKMSSSDRREHRKALREVKAKLEEAKRELIASHSREALVRNTMAVLSLRKAHAEKVIADYMPMYVGMTQ